MMREGEKVLKLSGWLSFQPPDFQDEVLRRGILQVYEVGGAVYHLGDPVGGVFGVMSGIISATTAPGPAAPRVIHLIPPGSWTGEGPFLTGQPRRLGLRALVESRILYLSLEAMEAMVTQDASCERRFGQIAMVNVDVLLRAVHDLLIKDPDRRIGAVLLRATAGGENAVPLSQADIGDMACASRKQVNFALGRFTAAGWVRHGYRSIALLDVPGLRAFVAKEDEG